MIFVTKSWLSILSCVFLFHLNISVCKRYDNYTLFRGIPSNRKELRFFKNLSQFYDVIFWRPPAISYRPVDFVIKPDDKEKLVDQALRSGVSLTTIMEDVQSEFDKQTVKTYIRRNMESFDWRDFFRLKDIYAWLYDVAKMYPNEVQIQSLGKTYEQRDILAVRLIPAGSKRRSVVIVEGGVHAREWVGPAFVTYLMHQLLKARTLKNDALRKVAETYEFYFVPVLNPDGYEYTHTHDRLWRKNREGEGTDINRNFGIAYGTVGISKDMKEETYCGKAAFSEKETAAMANLIREKGNKTEYYLAFHSYGQYMIIPYAFSTQHMDNYEEVRDICLDAAQVIKRRHGSAYTVGTAYDTVGYLTSGVSGCWAKKAFKIPYVVTFELRDEGQYGFALPPNYILPTCEETLDGVVSILTPKSVKYSKLRDILPEVFHKDGQKRNSFNIMLIIFDVILFVLVKF